jgi:hypothetical protein
VAVAVGGNQITVAVGVDREVAVEVGSGGRGDAGIGMQADIHIMRMIPVSTRKYALLRKITCLPKRRALW